MVLLRNNCITRKYEWYFDPKVITFVPFLIILVPIKSCQFSVSISKLCFFYFIIFYSWLQTPKSNFANIRQLQQLSCITRDTEVPYITALYKYLNVKINQINQKDTKQQCKKILNFTHENHKKYIKFSQRRDTYRLNSHRDTVDQTYLPREIYFQYQTKNDWW